MNPFEPFAKRPLCQAREEAANREKAAPPLQTALEALAAQESKPPYTPSPRLEAKVAALQAALDTKELRLQQLEQAKSPLQIWGALRDRDARVAELEAAAAEGTPGAALLEKAEAAAAVPGSAAKERFLATQLRELQQQLHERDEHVKELEVAVSLETTAAMEVQTDTHHSPHTVSEYARRQFCLNRNTRTPTHAQSLPRQALTGHVQL